MAVTSANPAGTAAGLAGKAVSAGTGRNRQAAIRPPNASALAAVRICWERSPIRMPRQSSRPKSSTRATPAATRRPASGGQQRLEVLGEDHAAERERGAEGDPVAPAHHEPGVAAQSPDDEHVLPAGAGHHRAGLGQGDGAEQGVETADHPHADEERRMGQPGRDFARSAEDPDDDGTADQHRDAEGDAEHLAQPAPAGWAEPARQPRRRYSSFCFAVGGRSLFSLR